MARDHDAAICIASGTLGGRSVGQTGSVGPTRSRTGRRYARCPLDHAATAPAASRSCWVVRLTFRQKHIWRSGRLGGGLVAGGHGTGSRHGTEHPFHRQPVETPCTTPPLNVDKPGNPCGRPAAETWTSGSPPWTSTKSPKPPHLAVTLQNEPLHLVVLALTTAIHRRIVRRVARPTETPGTRPAIGPIHRPGARPPALAHNATTEHAAATAAGWKTEEH